MKNLGAAIAGGLGEQRAHGYYPTPAEATVALLAIAGDLIGPVIHEPACGTGEMAEVFRSYGREVVATDLIDRGYGRGGIDFLKTEIAAPDVITNPPFQLATEFIEHACSQEPAFFALLLKATFWNAARRAPLFARHTPKMVLPLTWRLDFTGGGSPTMDCMWCVWGSRVPNGFVFRPLTKPNLGVFA